MHGVGSSGRGERGRVARRVADLLGSDRQRERAERAGALREGAPARHDGQVGPRRAVREWLQALAVRYTGVRVVPGRRAAVAVGLLTLLVAAVTVWWVLASRPHAVPVSHPTAGTGAAATASSTAQPVSSIPAAGSAQSTLGPRRSTTRAAPAVVVVDVAGKVRHPGVYRLPAGSRVNDAITAAGGALPEVDLSSLNLAATLRDGEQIAVGVPGAGPAAEPGGGAGSAGDPSSAPVDLNTASLTELEALPGVGPVLAQHILDWRAAHGGFARVDQLREVSGIGPVTFSDLQELVTV